jgi:hypothetical protein
MVTEDNSRRPSRKTQERWKIVVIPVETSTHPEQRGGKRAEGISVWPGKFLADLLDEIDERVPRSA